VSGLHVLVGAALRRRREVYRNKPRLANEYDRPLNLALHGIEVRPKLFGCRLIGDHDIDGLAVSDALCAWRPRDHLEYQRILHWRRNRSPRKIVRPAWVTEFPGFEVGILHAPTFHGLD